MNEKDQEVIQEFVEAIQTVAERLGIEKAFVACDKGDASRYTNLNYSIAELIGHTEIIKMNSLKKTICTTEHLS